MPHLNSRNINSLNLQRNNTFEMAALTVYLEVESASVKRILSETIRSVVWCPLFPAIYLPQNCSTPKAELSWLCLFRKWPLEKFDYSLFHELCTLIYLKSLRVKPTPLIRDVLNASPSNDIFLKTGLKPNTSLNLFL
jgi:hypothetical protein